jgi:hypothetical protein
MSLDNFMSPNLFPQKITEKTKSTASPKTPKQWHAATEVNATACPPWDKQCRTSLGTPPQIHRPRYDEVVSSRQGTQIQRKDAGTRRRQEYQNRKRDFALNTSLPLSASWPPCAHFPIVLKTCCPSVSHGLWPRFPTVRSHDIQFVNVGIIHFFCVSFCSALMKVGLAVT